MTNLQELYKSKGLDSLKEEISKYSTSQLFEELDDTIQLDILNVSHEKWVIDLMHEKKYIYVLYRNFKNAYDYLKLRPRRANVLLVRSSE